MRIFQNKRHYLSTFAIFSIVFAASFVSAEEVTINYDHGTRIGFQESGVEILSRVELQPEYTFNNNDNRTNESNFGLRRARPVFEANALSGLISGRVSAELSDRNETDGKRDDALKDGWVDFAPYTFLKLRAGQFKVPFGKQFLVDETKYNVASRAIATDYFSFGREQGAMIFGEESGLFYSAAVTNGDSQGEGENLPGIDTKHLGSIVAGFSTGGFDRCQEGAFGVGEELQFSAAASAATGSMNDNPAGSSDLVMLGGDGEVRYQDISFGGEYFFRHNDFVATGNKNESGFYLQVGAFMVPDEWEVASRYGVIFGEEDLDQTEYATTVTRYLKGHDLKVQLNLTFLKAEMDTSQSLSDQELTLLATLVL